ncbi:MAG: hypothetical protein ACR2IK_09950 [Chloroflexota bacterium]
MVPRQAGGGRFWRALQRVRNWSPSLALGVSLVLGAVLGQSSLATAQPAGPGLDSGFFPATGYRIGSPEVLAYFEHRGGVRTFGYPVSNEFPLLGQRVQIFQRQMVRLAADGTVSTANILDPDVLPVSHIDGLSLPSADPELLGGAPVAGSDNYTAQALSFVSVYVPDTWNGLNVNFQTTFLNTVTCADAYGADPCDESQLPVLALELWGLPTSLPTTDPVNADFVYQRFQKGIMHFSRATGFTQGLLIGDWLKRILVGVDLSPDIGMDVRHSRFFAQYAPSRPLALDRPADLPDTSLAQAFRADTLSAAGQTQLEPTLPANVASTATSVALTATAITATQVSFQSTQTGLQGTQVVLTQTAAALAATALVGQFTPTPTPMAAVSTVPVVNLGCMGDEQLWFTPRRPNIGVHVDISVTSQRHHDARSMRLTGPLDPGPVTERTGPLGFVWTWTVVPAVEDFHQWTFYADGLRPCITSGFNAYLPLGATSTPTLTPQATNTPGPTSTPTSTVVPMPSVANATQNGTCGSVITVVGSNFGSPPSNVGTNVQLLAGPSNAGTPKLLNLIGGSNTQLTATLPSNGLVSGGGYALIVSNNGGASNTVPFTVTGAPGTTC